MEKEKFDKVAYNNQFIAGKYDRINLTVPKGYKEIIQEAAKQNGESVNAYINRLIREGLERLEREAGEAGGGSHSEGDPGDSLI